MSKGRRTKDNGTRPAAGQPIPLAPIDLLAGLAPGLELHTDELPPGIDMEVGDGGPPATISVAEAGRLLRCGDAIIRRLIRTAVLRPVDDDGTRLRRQDVEDLARAGVIPRTRERPGE